MPDAQLPFEMLLTVMHQKWDAGDRDAAAALARIAVPSLHSCHAAIRDIPLAELQQLNDAELDRLIEGPDERVGAA